MDLVEATRDDAELLAEYWFQLASEMEPYSELNELAHDDPEDVVEGIARHHIDGDDTTAFLLEVDDRTVGSVLVREGEHPSRALDRYLQIVDLFVEQGHRSRGHGTAAIECVERLARERGVDYLKVSCEWANEGARSFYEDNGFTEKQVTYTQRVE
ncbi:GNAT family N-acetyltransferase [Halomicrobium sp. LC1Hm]|uniref:GNAT family N-acetyltransferase n=1 Tax=Halomicrobium sp. LC1Hm TaxID=2610902 RepID=UPI0012984F5D|nr:GNAT family N-acetyltransferase [Halomicrobium sp. LC1Hm]QGA81710.1 Acetyltransferase (GNAT) family [Halomicrobium sp. LC1Hm]